MKFTDTAWSAADFTEQLDKSKSVIDLKKTNSNSILFSDSILIWTNNSDYENLVEFIYKIQGVVQNTLMGGFPLRGTIEYGPLYHNPRQILTENSYNYFNSIGGSALMNAYREEQNFDWMGCTTSRNCSQKIKEILNAHDQGSDFKNNDIFKTNVLVEYEAPKKIGDVINLYTINWVNPVIKGMFVKNEISSLFLKHCINVAVPREVKRKIDNTNKYIKYIIDNQLITPLKFK